MMVLGVQIAEIQPVRAELPKLLVERSNFWDGVDLSRVEVVAVDHENQAVNHRFQLYSRRKTVVAEPG